VGEWVKEVAGVVVAQANQSRCSDARIFCGLGLDKGVFATIINLSVNYPMGLLI
jgi:hypothetical protein